MPTQEIERDRDLHLKYRGHCRSSAYSKDALAKPRMEASVLYMAMATPAQAQSLGSHPSPCQDRPMLRIGPT